MLTLHAITTREQMSSDLTKLSHPATGMMSLEYFRVMKCFGVCNSEY